MQMQTSTAAPYSPALPNQNPWLTITEYAAREGIARATVWRWVSKGILEIRRKGKRIGVKVRERI